MSEVESVAPSTQQPSTAEILAPFENARLAPTPPHPLYRLGLALVAVTMVLLPLIYLSLIVLLTYGLYLHANGQLIDLSEPATYSTRGRRDNRGDVVLWLAPLVVGSIVLLFMIKPLFAPRAKPRTTFSLDPEQEPLLFEYVAKLAALVHAPVPKRIDVDTNVNASASFRRGLLSFVGGDLVLTIGLPLAAGLSLRQLSGVIAHEFGHFAQGSGMRFSYVVRSISYWFARIVYERDAWDHYLKTWTANFPYWPVQLTLLFAQGCVWLTRRVLWVLMWIGNVVSCFLLRQMEYDADRHEAQVAGSQAFAETSQALVLLGLASNGANVDLSESWNEHRLVDNYAALFLANVDQIHEQEGLVEQVRDSTLKATTGFFDTHPATRDRIAAAEKLAAPGLITLDAPGSILFKDFEATCRAVTLDFYRKVLDTEIRPEQLMSTQSLVTQQAENRQGNKTLYRYTQGQLLKLRQIFCRDIGVEIPADAAAARATIEQIRQTQLAEIEQVKSASQLYEAADHRVHQMELATFFLTAGISADPKAFGLSKWKAPEVQRALEQAGQQRITALPVLDSHAQHLVDRLEQALAALKAPWFDELHGPEPTASLRQRTQQLLPAHNTLGDCWGTVKSVEPVWRKLGALFLATQSHPNNSMLGQRILGDTADLAVKLRSLRERLDQATYPFEHGEGPTRLGQHLLPTTPMSDDVMNVYAAAQETLQKSHELYFRLLGGITLIAETIETALGLPTLPEPEPKPKPDATPDAQPTAEPIETTTPQSAPRSTPDHSTPPTTQETTNP